jgi:hypothetical protein
MGESGVIVKDLPDWESFHSELQELRSQYDNPNSPLLFRGQNDSELRLTTTLERAGYEDMSFERYLMLVTRIRPAVETFTGVKWEYKTKISTSFHEIEFFAIDLTFPEPELYRYLVFLRHHGFPSPLLDWSRSPYVAAFFAFRDLILRPRDAGPMKRSIYIYCEFPKGSKGGAVGGPVIHPLGSYVRSHPRHFRQQSDYTLCGAFDQRSGWKFHPHEAVLGSRGDKQDVLWKFNLPSSESAKVLRVMDEYNLNAFSLFDSEESLLETMWFRERASRS